MASKIEDYGLIGNMRTAALVSRSGSIDWLCAPRFDSDSCFASLVGYDEHGRWSIRPAVNVRESTQRYRGDTLILETEFACDGGVVRVTDGMPVEGGPSDIFRIVEGVEGSVPMEMLLNVRFGYGADAPAIAAEGNDVRFVAGPNALVLRAPFEHMKANGRASAFVDVKKGDRIPLQLSWYESHEQTPKTFDVNRALSETESYWQSWSKRCTCTGKLRDTVMRSLLTLKALTYAPTGGIAAAPTTSLPEQIGGVRNWDYRFCWLRDASLTLDALIMCGYLEEAGQFRDWLLRAIAGSVEDVQIMYDLGGGRRLTEFELDWLPGYEGSKPVRVGNAASGQFQLDVYGEVTSAIYLARAKGLAGRTEGWSVAKGVMQFLEQAWQRPDDGIWEVRGGRRHFTHSKIMAWVAFDRAIKVIEQWGDGGDEAQRALPHLRALRERIHEEVCERGYNPRIGAFTQSYGSDALDASTLLMPHTGFLPASDPRVKGTVRAIEQSLLRDGFVLRYSTEHGTDGLPGSEGAFLACSFWLADNYAMAGRLNDAEALFDRLLGLRNHLGLLAEEYEPALKRQIGNFPQAFSHLALILTAQILEESRKTARKPSQKSPATKEPPRAP
jgi:GH15 family glucan-1,4-alpha-glucosidase